MLYFIFQIVQFGWEHFNLIFFSNKMFSLLQVWRKKVAWSSHQSAAQNRKNKLALLHRGTGFLGNWNSRAERHWPWHHRQVAADGKRDRIKESQLDSARVVVWQSMGLGLKGEPISWSAPHQQQPIATNCFQLSFRPEQGDAVGMGHRDDVIKECHVTATSITW